ncbi:hypothetical protein E4K72_05165 [Oxalobacteraceae bacterium OM1]|nr:hypothetical protein E4K72_05165 [Oxalobacteraceae bacterium OM1]
MDKLPAIAGWQWVKEGFALFRKQPVEMSTLFLSYLFVLLAMHFIPYAGQFLAVVLTPVLSMAFMQACVQIEQGKKVYPTLLATGFRKPAFKPLFQLGVLYLLTSLLAYAAFNLVGDNVFTQMMDRKLDPASVSMSGLFLAGVVMLLLTPAFMAFWYAAPLICWKRMSVGKALFYSFFAVRRSGKPFILYGLAWFMLCALVGLVISLLSVLVSSWLRLLLPPVSLILAVVIQCSFYPTYTAVFGRPDDATSPSEKMMP